MTGNEANVWWAIPALGKMDSSEDGPRTAASLVVFEGVLQALLVAKVGNDRVLEATRYCTDGGMVLFAKV